MLKAVAAAFAQADIERLGVCALAGLPLLPVRARLPAGARAVIVCLLPCYGGAYKGRNVARYAVYDDYHRTGGLLLESVCAALREAFPGEEFTPFIDASPLPEVRAAALAGLGVAGRHGMLIAPDIGADCFIAAVVTALALPVSVPASGECLGCGACIAVCPTGALSEDGFCRERCRSFLTQKKGALLPEEEAQIRAGGLAWGCDICLDACPMNRRELRGLPALLQNPQPAVTLANLDTLLPLKAYGYRGRAVMERNLRLIQAL